MLKTKNCINRIFGRLDFFRGSGTLYPMKTYFINSNRRSRLPIAVSFEEQMPKYQVAHRHDGYEIMFISSGYGWCAVNGVRMPLLAGDLFFMGMEDEHEFLLRAPGSYYNIMFRPELIPESDQESLRQAPFFLHFGKPEFTFQRKAVFPLRISGYLVEQFRQMYQESLNSHFALPLQLRSRLYHILVKIGEYSMLFGEARTTDREDIVGGRVVNHILNHCQERLSLAGLAKLTPYSPEYLGKIFHRQMGISFTEYLAYVRIEKARILLESPDWSLAEIAGKTGFFDAAHLTRTFRKVTGMLPRDFRRSLQQGGSHGDPADFPSRILP